MYDGGTFQRFQKAVSSVGSGNCGDLVPSAEGEEKFVGQIEEKDRRPLLQDSDETGFQINLTEEDVKGRFFAVVDGNHRLTAVKSPQVRNSTSAVRVVRCGVVRMETILELVEAGTLVNMIRGIQAADNFYDRFLWVCLMTSAQFNMLVLVCRLRFTMMHIRKKSSSQNNCNGTPNIPEPPAMRKTQNGQNTRLKTLSIGRRRKLALSPGSLITPVLCYVKWH